MLTKRITKEELLVVTAARQIKNGDVWFWASGFRSLPGFGQKYPCP